MISLDAILGSNTGRFTALFSTCLVSVVLAQEPAYLGVEPGASRPLLTLFRAEPRDVHYLECSTDLIHWGEIAFANRPYDDYALARTSASALYRVRSRPADASSDWTNQLEAGDQRIFTRPDPGGAQSPSFAKFTVLLDDSERVYFQDSDRYPFHYDFARAVAGLRRDCVSGLCAHQLVSQWPAVAAGHGAASPGP